MVPGLSQRKYLGVIPFCVTMKGLPDDPAPLYQHASHRRIGTRMSKSPASHFQRTAHITTIGVRQQTLTPANFLQASTGATSTKNLRRNRRA
jgi:hypothetical protein